MRNGLMAVFRNLRKQSIGIYENSGSGTLPDDDLPKRRMHPDRTAKGLKAVESKETVDGLPVHLPYKPLAIGKGPRPFLADWMQAHQ